MSNKIQSGKDHIVILIHGALADERMWDDHKKLLSKDYEAISRTQRHFGRNGYSDKGSFGIVTHSEDLANFIDSLNTTKPTHLIAWSYGADVALNMLVNHPNLASSLFIYEPGFPGYLNDDEINIFKEDASAMFGPVFQLVNEGKLEIGVQKLIDGSGNKEGYFESQAEDIKLQQLENAHTLPKQLNQNEMPNLTTETLSKITIPVTVAWGSNTRNLFEVVANAASALIPNVRKLRVNDATHMLPIEQPDLFSLFIREHIENIKI